MAKRLTPGQQALVADIVAAGLADEATAAMGDPTADKQVDAWKRAMGRRTKNMPDAPPRFLAFHTIQRGEY